MRRAAVVVIAVVLAGTAVSGPGVAPAAQAGQAACVPTRPDALGPFYTPNAPVRSSVGRGHALRGVVRSAAGCGSLPGARIELWLAGPDGQYRDEHRATIFADRTGAYRFESHFPGRYPGRPPHIHIRVVASGHDPLVTQYYPQPGQTEGTLDLVLAVSR